MEKRGIFLMFMIVKKLNDKEREYPQEVAGLRLWFFNNRTRQKKSRQRQKNWCGKKNASNFFLDGFFSYFSHEKSNRWQPTSFWFVIKYELKNFFHYSNAINQAI